MNTLRVATDCRQDIDTTDGMINFVNSRLFQLLTIDNQNDNSSQATDVTSANEL